MKEKRGPGRPPGTSPNGNPVGSSGNRQLKIRWAPAVLAEIEARGGTEWVRELVEDAVRQDGDFTAT